MRLNYLYLTAAFGSYLKAAVLKGQLKFPPLGGVRWPVLWQGGVYTSRMPHKPLPTPSRWEGITLASAFNLSTLRRDQISGNAYPVPHIDGDDG
jgi:hypothetical protein